MGPQGALARRRLLEELNLLCGCGAGLSAIAVRACTLIRNLAGAASASFFWNDFDGNPAGFYHDCAPAEIKDIFVTRFDELFSSPDEFNMVGSMKQSEPSIGSMLLPGNIEAFWQSNVYTFLCKPLDHHHLVEMRIDADSRGIGLICLWNGMNDPFGSKHVEAIRPAQAMLQRAAQVREPMVQWRSRDIRTAHFVTDLGGERLNYISAEAEDLLKSAHLLRQNLPMAQALQQAPLFARQLSAQLGGGGSGAAQLHIPVLQGRLVASASRARRVQAEAGDGEQMFVTLDLEVPVEVEVVQIVSALPLTLLQKEVLLFAVWGGERGECERMFGVTPEALKKHVRAILKATGSARWQDLSRLANL